MKKTILITTFLFLFVLWGCFNTTKVDTTTPTETTEQVNISPEAQDQADLRVTGNQTCDNYIATIECIADKWGEENEFSKNYDSILASFKDMPADQLQEVCTSLTTSLQEDPTVLLYNAECNKTNSGEENDVETEKN